MKWSELSYGNDFYIPYTENQRAVRGYFLHTLGIDLENIPEEYFEPCTLYNSEGHTFSQYSEQKVFVQNVLGSSYSGYAGDTWIMAFLKIKRAPKYIEMGEVTPSKYFWMLKQPAYKQNAPIKLTQTKDGFYIDGNGNHRITMYKMMYYAALSKSAPFKLRNLNYYWFYANVRQELT